MSKFWNALGFALMSLTIVGCQGYALKRCGFGFFAYQMPFIAAVTGQCDK